MSPLAHARQGRLFYLHTLFLILTCVFSWTMDGRAQKLNESTLYSFTNTLDGSYPIGGVIQGRDGSLYGTTSYGGSTNGYGMLFQINRNGSGYHIIHACDFTTGRYPGALSQGTNGLLYGAMTSGGSNGYGTIFSINTNGTGYTQLHALSTLEGEYPSATLFQGSNGVLYGVAPQGGTSNAGTVFRLNLNGSGFQVLHSFTNSPDGAVPASVIQGIDGVLYGTTANGGISNAGIVFSLTTNGNNYAILRAFTNSPDGSGPEANLIQGKDGMLYGTTVFGGTAYIYGGTLFRINTNGNGYQVLHNFPTVGGDGINPDGLIQGSDGLLYGVVGNSGAFGNGMVFKTDTNGGGYTVIFGFTNSPPDGRDPVSPLVEAGDGAFYGTADHGGAYDQGTVFRLAPPLMLSAQFSSGGNTNTAVLSWPAWASDYGLRTSPTLSNTLWSAMAPPVAAGGKFFTTNKSTAPNAFFRLQNPP
jgi:uncharacterized repeat protein (TIGR03803 family)